MGVWRLIDEMKRIASSITGVSTPIFGISWMPPIVEVDIARRIMILLSDKRALDFDHNPTEHIITSIIDVRKELNQALAQLPSTSKLTKIALAMRGLCHWILTETEKTPITINSEPIEYVPLSIFQRRMFTLTALMVETYKLNDEFDQIENYHYTFMSSWLYFDEELGDSSISRKEMNDLLGIGDAEELNITDHQLLRSLLGFEEDFNKYISSQHDSK